MSCTFEDAFLVNPFAESADDSIDSTPSTKPAPVEQSQFNPLDELKALIKSEPEINAAKVAFLKAEIESGNYQVNSHVLASKLVSEF